MSNILNIVKPYPGSTEAVELGCKCPVIDNEYGRGHYGVAGEFVVNMNCPIHSVPVNEVQKMMGITK